MIMGKNLLGNAHMQEMGVHIMGANIKHDIKELTPEEIAAHNKKMEEEQLLTANRLLELNKGTKDASKMKVAATGYTVIIKPFEKNPYREIKTSASGLILPGDLFADTYKSDDTGEMERAEQFIACGTVISAGPECKYVKPGEDVYYRNSVVPIPFNNMGYYAISEQNIICRVIEKDKE